MTFVPVVDIAKIGLLVSDDANVTADNYKNVGTELYKALSTTGFAYLLNSGITDADIHQLQQMFDKFFALDINIKEAYNYEKNGAGYFGIGKENAAEYGDAKDYKEVFNINGDFLTNSEYNWPDEYVSEMSKNCKDFMKTCAKLSRRLFSVISYGMKLKDKTFLSKRHLRLNDHDNHTTLRCNYFPIVPEDFKKTSNLRLGPHSDYGTFTLLFQDNIGGLQCKNLEGQFEDVKPIPDSIVMNIGDIMNLWTMGRLKSTEHRVAMPPIASKQIRHSIAYFLHPDDEVPIEEMDYEPDADSPRPERLLFNKKDSDAPRTAIQWAFDKFYKTHGIKEKWSPPEAATA